MPATGLSKSLYLRGLQCLKSLWLQKNRPGLRDAFDPTRQSILSAGKRVGDLAKDLFAGGVEIPFTPHDFPGMVRRTREFLDSGEKTIYEATFERDGIVVMADILTLQDHGWNLLEVKSSTSVKEYQLPDVAIQWYVINSAISLKEAAVVHINSSYIRRGILDLSKLFTVEPVTTFVEDFQKEIPGHLRTMRDILQEGEPGIEIGEQCTSPFVCDFYGYCWKNIPEQSVFQLYRMSMQKKLDLHRRGITALEEIPDDFPLTEHQRLQVETHRTGTPRINHSILNRFFQKLKDPLSFLDFESFQEPVPRFNNQRPYQQIPFQYSLHIDREGEGLSHIEFLADETEDPRRFFTEHLLDHIPDSGSIIAYNISFEKMILRMMAREFPDLASRLESLMDRFVDLLEPFRSRGYHHPDFQGSLSIKSVLPALFPDDPELDYHNMEIGDGQMAMESFASLPFVEDPGERKQIRLALLNYCRLDTYAMVKILEKLKEDADPHGTDLDLFPGFP